jgi:PHD/YefM family antitoxin component YafN of YafNO toxin-antitoxin module
MAKETPTAPEAVLLSDEEKAKFHALMDELENTRDPEQRDRILEQLAQLTFGC